MSGLNTKQGNVRGVKLQFANRETESWSEKAPVQGWVVYNGGEHKFNLNFDVEEYDVEIFLSEDALINMMDAIEEYANRVGA